MSRFWYGCGRLGRSWLCLGMRSCCGDGGSGAGSLREGMRVWEEVWEALGRDTRE